MIKIWLYSIDGWDVAMSMKLIFWMTFSSWMNCITVQWIKLCLVTKNYQHVSGDMGDLWKHGWNWTQPQN